MALNHRHEVFIHEYLISENATQAALIAGYSKKSAYSIGHELLNKPEIRSRIENRQAEVKAEMERRAAKVIVTKEQWLAAVAEIAFADMDDFVTLGPNQDLQIIETARRKKGKGRIIKKISVTAQGSVTLELHPKLPALELIAKHFGWISDKLEHTGQIASKTIEESDFKQIFSDPESMELARKLALRMSQGGKDGEN